MPQPWEMEIHGILANIEVIEHLVGTFEEI
jgi:hypothetical protein